MTGRHRIGRRGFLLGTAAAAFLGPSMVRADGEPMRPAKRFVVFYTPNGFLPEQWRPVDRLDSVRFRPGSILEPLSAHREAVLPLWGLNMESANHGPVARSPRSHGNAMMHALTAAELPPGDYCSGGSSCVTGRTAGIGGGISVDEFIADRVGGESPLRILHLGVGPRQNEIAKWTLSYRGRLSPVPDERDPRAAFDRVFSATGAHQQRRRASVLDNTLEDLRRLEGRLGATERARLRAHTTSLRELERELGASGRMCNPEDPGDLGPANRIPVPEASRLQLDILVNALACDRTRVATVTYNAAQGKMTYPWLTGMDGRNHHQLGHDAENPAAAAQHLAIGRWYAGEFQYLLDAMRAIPEGDGTLLDNSLVLWCSEHSHPTHHAITDMQYLLAGRAGGALRTGRCLEYVRDEPHGNLLVSLCHAMDVDVDTFGTPEWCTGPLSGLI